MRCSVYWFFFFFFFRQKTAYELRISDWSSDVCSSDLWRTQVADDVLRELIYTNREFTGSEAKLLGFATHVADDPLTKAMELAAAIADKNPHAIRGAKRLCNLLADANDAQILQAESDEQVRSEEHTSELQSLMRNS